MHNKELSSHTERIKSVATNIARVAKKPRTLLAGVGVPLLLATACFDANGAAEDRNSSAVEMSREEQTVIELSGDTIGIINKIVQPEYAKYLNRQDIDSQAKGLARELEEMRRLEGISVERYRVNFKPVMQRPDQPQPVTSWLVSTYDPAGGLEETEINFNLEQDPTTGELRPGNIGDANSEYEHISGITQNDLITEANELLNLPAGIKWEEFGSNLEGNKERASGIQSEINGLNIKLQYSGFLWVVINNPDQINLNVSNQNKIYPTAPDLK